MGWLRDAVELAVATAAAVQRWETQMATWTEQLAALSAQLSKAAGEINTRIDELVAALDSPTPEQQAALDSLRGQVQVLDDIVPDAPAEPEPGA